MTRSDDIAERLESYVAGLFATEDDVLRALRESMADRGFPDIAVSATEGALLRVLLTAIGARHVLEIGTLGGYSAIWMARALPPDGRLVTLEVDPERADFAREFATRAGLGTVIDVRARPALATLATFGERTTTFDACFIDADKENYPAYLDHALRLVRPGGLVLADNVFWSGRVLDQESDEETTRAMREFNHRMATDSRLRAMMIPVRDGLAVAVVLPTQ